jgi:flagellar hook assembly protein FlgD
MLGQEVATLVNEVKEAGEYSVRWNGTDNAGHQVASGIYFYSVRAGEFKSIKKMVLLK